MPIMQAALRVLAAVTEHQEPQRADIDFLRRVALPEAADLPPDELAREIVERELAKRKAH